MSSSTPPLSNHEELRLRALMRMNGLAEMARLRRETGDPKDIADAAFILGSITDFCDYVDALRDGHAVLHELRTWFSDEVSAGDESLQVWVERIEKATTT